MHVCPLSGSRGGAVYVSSSSSLLRPSPLHCGSASGPGVCSSQAFRSDGIPQENHVSFLHGTLSCLPAERKVSCAIFRPSRGENNGKSTRGKAESTLGDTKKPAFTTAGMHIKPERPAFPLKEDTFYNVTLKNSSCKIWDPETASRELPCPLDMSPLITTVTHERATKQISFALCCTGLSIVTTDCSWPCASPS